MSIPCTLCVTFAWDCTAPSSDPLPAETSIFYLLVSHLSSQLLKLDFLSKNSIPSRLHVITAPTLCGPTSTSLHIMLPSLPCIVQPRKFPFRYCPYPSLQKTTPKLFPVGSLLHKFDLVIFTRCVLQMPLKTLLISFCFTTKGPY